MLMDIPTPYNPLEDSSASEDNDDGEALNEVLDTLDKCGVPND